MSELNVKKENMPVVVNTASNVSGTDGKKAAELNADAVKTQPEKTAGEVQEQIKTEKMDDKMSEKIAPVNENTQKSNPENEFLEFKKALDELNRELKEETKGNASGEHSDSYNQSENKHAAQKPDKWDKYIGAEPYNAGGADLNKNNAGKASDWTSVNAQKTQKTEDPTIKKQINEVKYAKMMSKIDFDLTRPTLSSADIKTQSGALAEFGFKSLCILASRMKLFKKKAKEINFCAVIGYPSGEMTENSKACEIKEALRAGAKEVDVFFRTSSLKDDKQKNILRELKRYRSIIGKKRIFKLSFDCELVNSDEMRFIADIAFKAKADYLVVRNCLADKAKLQIAIAKTCANKCKVEYADNVTCLADMERFSDLGADRFLLTEAKEVAKKVREEL